MPEILKRENKMPTLYSVLFQLLTIYSWIIIIWIVFGMLVAQRVLPHNQFTATVGALLYKVTEPVLGFVRRFLPSMGGFDLSPLVVLITIWILKAIVVDLASF